MAQVTVSQLSIYPVKSLGGIDLPHMRFDDLGPMYDRRYMLVNEAGEFITQRQYPILSQVHVSATNLSDLSAGFNVSIPEAPGSSSRESIFLAAHGETDISSAVETSVWSDTFQAYQQQHPLADHLSRYLQHRVKLLFISYSQVLTPRHVDSRYTAKPQALGFADGFPSLVCYQTSLEALNHALDLPISMRRFRPNIVVAAAGANQPEAFAENNWQQLANEQLRLELVKPCSRCVMPTIEPNSSSKQAAVWQALKRLNSLNGEVIFGQNALQSGAKVLHLADQLKVMH
ncbi:MAG: MOSC N-terminal beta barrel domain-containing protein [Pseudomonadales bacterium]|nr:MOSC N-terminal beta barrel domain-containing protein [Pseudomonadales bacterium]